MGMNDFAVMAGVDMGSFPGLTVMDCWVVGLERFAVGPDGEEEFFEIRTEWSENTITYLRRRYHDLVKLANTLEKLHPEDSGSLTRSLMLNALQKIKEAKEKNEIETRLDEVEKLLKHIVKMPQKYSQCEAVIAFFKTSPLDYTLKTMFDPIQLSYQSPVTVADVRRANGFCLANTETVLYDAHLQKEASEPSYVHKYTEPSSKCSSEMEAQVWTGRFQRVFRRDQEFVDTPHSTSPGLTASATENEDAKYRSKTSQVTTGNLTCLHLHACETDILE